MRRLGRRRPWTRWLLIFLVLAVLIGGAKACTIITGRPNPVDTFLGQLMAPVIGVPRSIGEGFRNLAQIPSALRENENLRAENALLERRAAELRFQATECERLHELLKLKPPPGFKQVAARVIARPYDLWLESVWINIGTRDGVRRGNLVVNAKGVVGIVREAQLSISNVTLVSSPGFRLGAITSGEQVAGVIHGVNGNTLMLGDIPVGTQVKPGEKVFTRGEETAPGSEDNRPRGIYIGMTSLIERDASDYSQITVEPAVKTNQLGYVVVYTQ